jgi:hypothetical protein
VALPFELQANAVVDQPFAIEPIGKSERSKEAHGTVFENARAEATLDIPAVSALEYDRLDTVVVQDVRQR